MSAPGTAHRTYERAQLVNGGCVLPRFVGDISYSFYRWHWPILILGAAAIGSPTTLPERMVLVMLALLVATASFYGNERPIHFPRWLGRHRYRTLTMWPAAVSSIVLAVAGGSTASPSAAAGATNASLSPTAAVRAGEANASRVVRQLAQQSGASWIDVQSWFCAGGRCPSLINGIVPCWNKRHMTKTYSRYLAPTLAPLLHLNG